MTSDSSERRGFIRIPFRTDVKITAGSCAMRSEGEINISMSGIRLSTTGALPPVGISCRVSIVLNPGGDPVPIEAAGKIIRSKPGTIAIEFTELDPDGYGHLRQLILNNAKDPDRAEQEFNTHWGIKPRGC
jgi:hypothetical protein